MSMNILYFKIVCIFYLCTIMYDNCMYFIHFMYDKCILIISTLLFPNLSFYLPIISSILKEREECNGMANVF